MEIAEEFSELGIVRGRIRMFRGLEALKIIQICRQRGIKILGIDGFFITEKATQPSMEHSVDYSYIDASLNCWDEAENFVRRADNHNLYFEIVTNENSHLPDR